MGKKQSELALIDKKDIPEKQYLELPAVKFLEAFGHGNHIPGSGSAAAFSALMAIELMKTVLKLSISKEGYRQYRDEFQKMLIDIESDTKPKFIKYFNDDIQVFHKVSYHRRLRDKSKTDENKDKHTRLANDKLREATDIPLDLCQTSLEQMNNAFSLFDNGFKGARGDSGVAISNLLSAAQGSLFVVFLNLKTFPKSKWKDERMDRAVKLATQFTQLQRNAYSRVITLYNENTDKNQLTLDFYR